MITFRFNGKMSYEDYLTMYRRLTKRNLILTYVIALLVILGLFWFVSHSWLARVITLVVLGLLGWQSYARGLPGQVRKMFDGNPSMQQMQHLDFYKGINLGAPVSKVYYFDDAVYLKMGKNQMLIVLKSWAEKPEHWSAFQGFVKVELDPKFKEK